MKTICKVGNAIFSLLGWVLIIGWVVNFGSHYGGRWVVGKFWMPETVFGADTWHYKDGAPVVDIQRWAALNGFEPYAWMLGFGLMGTALKMGWENAKRKTEADWERENG